MKTALEQRCLFVCLLAGLTIAITGCDAAGDAAAWIETAEADSHAADQALALEDPGEAAAHLEALVNREVPGGVAEQDARVVRQDAYDRLARIELDRGDLDRAERWVNEGLELGDADDVFVANLYTTRAQVHEARGDDREAARDYHRAIQILEHALSRALGEAP